MESLKFVHNSNYSITTRDSDFKSDLRVSSLVNFFIQAAWKHAIEEIIPSLKFEEKNGSITNYRVSYNDIDMNLHLTTVRYIDFLFDTYDLEFMEKNIPKEITVNFLKEVPFGAELIMYRFENSDVHRFELINSSNNSICFRAEIRY